MTLKVKLLSPGDIWRYPVHTPSTLRDWYQSVPQDMNFHIFYVNKKLTLAKFRFLQGRLEIFWDPKDFATALEVPVGPLETTHVIKVWLKMPSRMTQCVYDQSEYEHFLYRYRVSIWCQLRDSLTPT